MAGQVQSALEERTEGEDKGIRSEGNKAGQARVKLWTEKLVGFGIKPNTVSCLGPRGGEEWLLKGD